MKLIWSFINANQSTIYKVLLVSMSSLIILYMFPKGGQFKYEFQKGKPWQYPTYYAPFDFSILKTAAQLAEDREKVLADFKPYYRVDYEIAEAVFESYNLQKDTYLKTLLNVRQREALVALGESLLREIYQFGVVYPGFNKPNHRDIFLIRDNIEIETTIDSLFDPNDLYAFVQEQSSRSGLTSNSSKKLYDFLFDLIVPNIRFDEKFSEDSKNAALAEIPAYRDLVKSGEFIIAQGEVVEGEQFQKLQSLSNEFISQAEENNTTPWIIFGYIILIVLTFSLLMMFLRKYRSAVYENNKKLTFIFFNILMIILFTTAVVNFDVGYIYAVPICILPLILKAFFDPRLGLFTHVITILLLGFIVPNSFEFTFLQIVAGIITIQSITKLYRRASLFISVGQIVLVYILGYLAFTAIQEGTLVALEWSNLGLFILNGLLTLFVQPLIYIYEKIFRLVSDVSLLELSDTNSNLLKRLAEKAPGTFHHSLQVANLVEAAANEIGADSLLVRVGALYHDIGKLTQPYYFSENQKGRVSPHHELEPKHSAQIIISHVKNGIELAKKYNLPDRVIDFIRTHHGTSTVYYFLKKAEEASDAPIDVVYFRYKGPKPFSKETALLMMADAIEAATKSLRNPTVEQLQDFVHKIVARQMEEKQFDASDITFGEIEIAKKIFFKKLVNIYQLRVEYPE